MNIKILTCHDVYNYGASLQAYALQTFLEKNGYEVKIIDYKPYYIDFPYKISMFVHPDSPVRKYTDICVFFKLLYALKRYIWYMPYWSRKKSFDKFTKQYLKLTRKYKSNDELLNNLPDADIYIVGSDQVWNSTTMLNGKDSVFYLQFAPMTKKKISYAASFGSTTISNEHTSKIKQWLTSFDAISVRESSGVDILNKLGIIGKHVCDPVFLLTESEWRASLNISEENEKYVLIYNLTSINKKLVQDAKKTADLLGVRLYSVSPMKIAEADKNFVNVGPERFVSLIFNASYVFTNSFHATAFSIISHRQFCTYNYHSKSNSSRMYSVLEEMDMLDRLDITDVRQIHNTPIDYHTKLSKIGNSINDSSSWLLKNIQI